MLVRRPGHPPKTTNISSGRQLPGISPSAPHGATKAGLPGSSFGGFRLQKLLMHLGHDGEGEAKPEHVGGGDDADANPRPTRIGAPDEPCWQGLRALEDYKRLYYRSHARMHPMLQPGTCLKAPWRLSWVAARLRSKVASLPSRRPLADPVLCLEWEATCPSAKCLEGTS